MDMQKRKDNTMLEYIFKNIKWKINANTPSNASVFTGIKIITKINISRSINKFNLCSLGINILIKEQRSY